VTRPVTVAVTQDSTADAQSFGNCQEMLARKTGTRRSCRLIWRVTGASNLALRLIAPPKLVATQVRFKQSKSLLKIASAAADVSRRTHMFTLNVSFTADEAISLMRVIAAKQWTERDVEKRDDLELIRLRLYDGLYHGQPKPTQIDMGCLTQKRKRERQHSQIPDGRPAHDPEQGHAPRPEIVYEQRAA
jgi:hypothetical protein